MSRSAADPSAQSAQTQPLPQRAQPSRALRFVKPLATVALMAALAWSFWYSRSWLQLCYGLALFLFGMQCIEEGLHSTAGGTLERLMARSTATPVRGMLFGIGATFLLQSTTLVSLLTMAFLSTGLITLAGGIAVLLGTNLGATSGIWLLALAGQSVSLAPAAIPMLVFGILASFFKGKAKPVGRILVGIALIFLGIDAIKNGFQAVGEMDLSALQMGGLTELALFCLAGLLLTIVLQSTHATLILTLAALAGGQITLMQGFAIAVGSNVGSSVSTAFVGMLGSERSGQRLALAHLIFNVVTAVLSLLLWWPLTRGVLYVGEWAGMGQLLQLALFHTLFNLLGLAVFWPWQKQFAERLRRWLPTPVQEPLIDRKKPLKPLYLNANVLRSGDTALQAVLKEVRHLGQVCLEMLARVLYIPANAIHAEQPEATDGNDEPELPAPPQPLPLDAQELYEQQIKAIYSALLDFTSKMELNDETQQNLLANAHMAAFQMVEVAKYGNQLQVNMQHYLQNPDSPAHPEYMRLRRHLFKTLRLFRQTGLLPVHDPAWQQNVMAMQEHIARLEVLLGRIMVKLRNGELDGWQTSSLMNDTNFARRIGQGLIDVLNIDHMAASPMAGKAGGEQTGSDAEDAAADAAEDATDGTNDVQDAVVKGSDEIADEVAEVADGIADENTEGQGHTMHEPPGIYTTGQRLAELETAQEILTALASVRSGWIFEEEQSPEPDAEKIAQWQREREELEDLTDALALHESAALQAAIDTYGPELKAFLEAKP